MAKTINEAFHILKENLEITGLQKSTVSTRQTNVREAVESKMEVLDSFLTGSYTRHTMIAPLKEADIDIFIILDPKYYENGAQATILDKVRKVLLNTYPNTPKISRNGQAVTIAFSDFKEDVVPAFFRKGGGFLIPDSLHQVWINTNPKIHVDLMANENSTHNGDLVPIVKMIKGWNKKINHGFVSFYLELLAVKLFKNVTISDFPSGIRFFFDKAREGIRYKIKDPVEYGGQINGLDSIATVHSAVNNFEKAYNQSRRAEDYSRQGKMRDAIEEWGTVFENYFPAYG